MSVSYPLVLLLLVPAIAAFAWLARRGDLYLARLPGDWERLVKPPLRTMVGREATQGGAPQLLSFLVLWVVLVAAVSKPVWELEDAPNLPNIAGRVIAMDLGGPADTHLQRIAAATLIDAAPDIPTALVVGSGDAFNVVPLTTDRDFTNRYLNVITPDVMPVEGRALPVTVAHSEAVLTRAGVAVGQVILLTGGQPPALGDEYLRRWTRVLVTESESWGEWVDYANYLGARLVSYDDVTSVIDDLEGEIKRAQHRGDNSAVHDLTPYLLGVAVLLWLTIFRRRRTT
tara:strand:- start:1506 stop:2363 length:858 start_codon:yes stop_codon:yes gene_type:complete